MKNTKEIVALYARISTGKQDFDMQLRDLKKTVKSNNYKVYKIYQDTKGGDKQREHLDEMIRDAALNKFSKLLIWKVDRLARNVRLGLNALFELEEKGNCVINVYTEPHLNTGAPGSKQARTYTLAGAEAEHEAIKARVRAAKNHWLSEQKWPVPKYPPFGYSCNKKYKLVIVEEQAKIVRLIFDLYVNSRLSMRKIYKLLNDKGYRSPAGIEWKRSAVRNIIANKIYTGEVMLGKKLGKYPFKCHPIISKALYQQAQEKKLERQTVNSGNVKRDYVLRGIMKCAKCGFNLFPRVKRSRGIEYINYQGVADETNVKRCKPRCGMISEIKVINMVANKFMQTWNDMQNNKNYDELNKLLPSEDENSKEEVERYKQRAKDIGKQILRIADNYEAGLISRADRDTKVRLRREELSLCDDKLNEFSQSVLTKQERVKAVQDIRTDLNLTKEEIIVEMKKNEKRLKELEQRSNKKTTMPVFDTGTCYAITKSLIRKYRLQTIYVDFKKNFLTVHTGIGAQPIDISNQPQRLSPHIYRRTSVKTNLILQIPYKYRTNNYYI